MTDASNTDSIRNAARRGDLEAVRRFVEVKGVNVDCMEEGFSPLISALYPHPYAKTSFLPVMRYLVSKGANVDTAAPCGASPLMIASKMGNLAAVKLLLEEGHANVNYSVPSTDSTALIVATRKASCHHIIPTLLQHGANVSPLRLKLRTCTSPLLNACRHQCASEVVQQLLDHGADPEATNTRGEKALSVAAEYSDEATIRLLIARGASVNPPFTKYCHDTPLSIAARRWASNNTLPIVRALLEHGAKVDVILPHTCSILHTPLHYTNLDPRVIVILLDHCRGSMTEDDLNNFLQRASKIEQVALHHASTVEIAKLLIELPRSEAGQLLPVCHAQLAKKNYHGLTPRELATRNQRSKLEEYLRTFESLPLSVPETEIARTSNATKRRKLNDELAVILNPTLNEFQQSVAQEASNLITNTMTCPESLTPVIMGYLSPLDVMKRTDRTA